MTFPGHSFLSNKLLPIFEDHEISKHRNMLLNLHLIFFNEYTKNR